VTEALREAVPEAWHTLEQDLDVAEPKEKVTLYLDRSVAKFYRAMGQGYQARINRLLATWAQMKIAEEVQLDAHLAARLRDYGPCPRPCGAGPPPGYFQTVKGLGFVEAKLVLLGKAAAQGGEREANEASAEREAEGEAQVSGEGGPDRGVLKHHLNATKQDACDAASKDEDEGHVCVSG